MDGARRHRMSLAAAVLDGVGKRPLDHGCGRGLSGLPAHDGIGEGVDDERGVAPPTPDADHVGEVGYPQQVRCAGGEPPIHQVGGPLDGVRVSDGGPWRGTAGDSDPAVEPHQPFHGAPRDLDALPVQVGPHLQAAVERLRAQPAVLIGLVVPGEHLGDRGVPQGSLRHSAT
jgi:hypothetical protein